MGEYISREAALTVVERLRDKCGNDEMAFALNWASGLLRNVPAADVVEVRHERWELAKDPFGAGYVKCSRCGYKHCPEYYPDGSAIMHLFCPSCGAKMDGGQDDVM